MIPLTVLALICAYVALPDDSTSVAALTLAMFVMAAKLADGEAMRSPIRSGLWLILCVWFFCDTFLSIAGVTLADDLPLYAPLVAMFALWAIKTSLLRRLKSEPLDKTRYMYALSPISGPGGVVNILRPTALAVFGGRAVIAGDYIYCVHKGVFKKLRLSLVDIRGYTLINSNEALNASTTARLDSIVGSQCIPLVYDCAQLRSNFRLETVLFRRGIVWIGTILSRLFKP